MARDKAQEEEEEMNNGLPEVLEGKKKLRAGPGSSVMYGYLLG